MNIIRLTKGCCILSFILILLFSSSCSTYSRLRNSSAVRHTDSIYIQTVFRDSVIYQVVQRDSIRVHDSVAVQIDSTGRIIERWHTVYRYKVDRSETERYKAKLDSVMAVSRRDSVVIVEKSTNMLTRVQQFKIMAFDILAGVLAIVALIGVAIFCHNRKRIKE